MRVCTRIPDVGTRTPTHTRVWRAVLCSRTRAHVATRSRSVRRCALKRLRHASSGCPSPWALTSGCTPLGPPCPADTRPCVSSCSFAWPWGDQTGGAGSPLSCWEQCRAQNCLLADTPCPQSERGATLGRVLEASPPTRGRGSPVWDAPDRLGAAGGRRQGRTCR